MAPGLPPGAAANLARLSRLQASPVNVLAQSLAQQAFKRSFAPAQRADVHGFGISQPKPQVAKLGFDLGASFGFAKRFGSDLKDTALQTPGAVVAAAGAIGHDVLHHPLDFHNTRSGPLALAMGKGFVKSLTPAQIKQHPGFAALSALAAAGAVGGAVSRVSAAGRAAAEAGGAASGAKASLLRPGNQGGSLLRPPPPGETTLRLNGLAVQRLEPDAAYLRPLHRFITKQMQARLDNPQLAGTKPLLGRAPENVIGREVSARGRVVGDIAQGDSHAIQQVTKPPKGTDKQAWHTAIRVAAIEGKGALRHPAEAIQRHIDTHLEQAAQATSKADARLHQTIAADLQKAEPVLTNPSRDFLRALRNTRRFSQQMTSEAIQRKLLTPEAAKSSLQTLAEAYGHKGTPEGAFYFPTSERFVLPGKGAGKAVFSPRPGEFGASPPDKGRYTMGTLRRRTGTALRRGVVENVPRALGQANVGRAKLYSAQDMFRQALRASTGTRQNEFQIPIRRSRAISPALRRQVAIDLEKAQGGDQNALARVASQLESELKADEHAKAPVGAQIPGVRWVDKRILKNVAPGVQDPVVGAISRYVNRPIRNLSVYARPAYVTTNYPQNVGMNILTQGAGRSAANLVRARRATKIYGPELSGKMEAAMGTARTESFVPRGKVGKVERGVVGGLTRLTDRDPRLAAFLYRAHQRGYRGKADLQRLFSDPTAKNDLVAITRRARKDAVDFDSITPGERGLSDLVYFYPWMSRSSAWAARTALNRPIKTAALAQAGRTPQAQETMVANAPSYMKGFLKSRFGLINPHPSGPFSTQGQIIQSLAHLGQNASLATEFGTPATSLLATAKKPSQILGSILGSTAPALALKRAGFDPKALQPLLGKPSKTFPETGVGPSAGPYMLGGLFPRRPDRAQVEKQFLTEQPAPARFSYKVRDLRSQFVAAEGKRGQKLSPELDRQLRLHAERYGSYKQAGLSTSESDYQQRALVIDLRLLQKKGLADAQQVAAWTNWAKTADPNAISRQRATTGQIGRFFPNDWINRAAKQLKLKVPY